MGSFNVIIWSYNSVYEKTGELTFNVALSVYDL